MKIWVDADGCPKDVKTIVFKAAERVQVEANVVANRPLKIPKSKYLILHVVSAGMDVADAFIEDRVLKGDLVITADIPLASQVIEKGALAIDPKGDIYDQSTISERLSIRNFLTDLRSSGQMTGGSAPRNNTHNHKFAASLDKLLQKLL